VVFCVKKRHCRVDRIAERRLNWSRIGSKRLPAKALGLHCNGKSNKEENRINVNEDREAKKLTVQQAMVLVWDRNKWKHQVAASSSWK